MFTLRLFGTFISKIGITEKFNPIWASAIQFFSKLPLGFLTEVGSKRVIVFHGGFPFNEEHFKVWNLEEAEKYLNCFQTEHFDMNPLSQAILWANPDPDLSEGCSTESDVGTSTL